MKLVRNLLLLAGAVSGLAGCFSPKFQEGLRCGVGDEPCPPGQSCDNGFCRSMAGPGVDVIGDPQDLDGDGFTNDQDNCPEHFNPGQYDEEFDGVGNECDPCPFATDNTDSDDDGVGDICDPAPQQFGESIVMFEGFDEPLSPDWLVSGNFLPGVSELAFNLFTEESGFVITPIVSDGSGVAMAGMIVDFVDPNTVGHRGIGVGHVDPGTGNGFTCTAGIGTDGMRNLSLFESTMMAAVAATPAPWVEGAFNVLYDVQVNPTTFQCGISGTATAFIQGPFNGAAPNVGLRARSMGGRYLWFMYVESPPR